jgi:hypothetical protein
MSVSEVSSLLNRDNTFSATLDHDGKVPVEHLDYGYIEKCKNVKHLEKILRVLR